MSALLGESFFRVLLRLLLSSLLLAASRFFACCVPISFPVADDETFNAACANLVWAACRPSPDSTLGVSSAAQLCEVRVIRCCFAVRFVSCRHRVHRIELCQVREQGRAMAP